MHSSVHPERLFIFLYKAIFIESKYRTIFHSFWKKTSLVATELTFSGDKVELFCKSVVASWICTSVLALATYRNAHKAVVFKVEGACRGFFGSRTRVLIKIYMFCLQIDRIHMDIGTSKRYLGIRAIINNTLGNRTCHGLTYRDPTSHKFLIVTACKQIRHRWSMHARKFLLGGPPCLLLRFQ